MKRFLLPAVVASALLLAADASGASGAKGFKLVRVNDAKSLTQPPGPFLTAPRTCGPDLGGQSIPGVAVQPAPAMFGTAFDPSQWDEISVAGDGKLLAYASSVSDAGVPGAAKQIVLSPGSVGAASKRIALASGTDDQPSLKFDLFGHRCAFRSSTAGGGLPSNIQLYTVTLGATSTTPTSTTGGTSTTGTTSDVAGGTTTAVTNITSSTQGAYDPALAAAVVRVDVGSGVKVNRRDAKIAFVSNADLVAGKNPSGLPQLFLWEEQGSKIRQLTNHQDRAAEVNRPTIAAGGDLVVFESTADLDPTSVDPMLSSRVGNPNHVRNLFRWRRGVGIDQITWSDGPCFSPRFDSAGRYVLFSCGGDPITGGNPERNLEIFQWTAGGPASQRLRQLTQTAEGDSVFPRPTTRRGSFVFYSTAHPPKASSSGGAVPKFGEGSAQCGASALAYDHGVVSLVEGVLDIENAVRLVPSRTQGQQVPLLVGPPAPGFSTNRVYFATNDYVLNPKPPKGSTTPTDEAQLLAIDVALATRRPGR